jgi:nitrogen fixation NifU-like protein
LNAPDLGDLYQETILDHNRQPRNFGTLPGANRTAEGFNPLCGDKVTVTLHVEDGVLKDIRFQGSGCAISKASASMMTESMKGKTRAEAEALFQQFHRLLTGEPAPPDESALGKLVVFSGVKEFPVRVKCATLAWHTLRSALENAHQVASTE